MARPCSPASDMMLVSEEERNGPMSIVILGIDLGKNSCSIVGVDAAGAVIVRRSMRRQTLIDYVLKLSVCVVAMEACCSAHHLGRLFAARGHALRLISPEWVLPYGKTEKTEGRDAEGSAESSACPTMRFVELKSVEQRDVHTLHGFRARLVAERTNRINQLRAILLEREVIFPVGRRKLELGLDSMMADDDSPLSPRMRQLVSELRTEWREFAAKLGATNRDFVQLAWTTPAPRRPQPIAGGGVLPPPAKYPALGTAR